MATYRVKRTVEAFQMTQKRRWDNSDWPEWLNKAWNLGSVLGGVWTNDHSNDVPGKETLICGTPEQPQLINWDDWIICNDGELSLCKPDVFEKNHQLVEAGATS